MDCRTARLLLDFARPVPAELAADDSRDLENHLAGCADCDSLARAERRLDEPLGQAMRAVPLPIGLRDRLLARLDAERGAWQRRWMFRGLAAAAVVALAVWGVSELVRRPVPLDLVAIRDEAVQQQEAPSAEKVAEWFHQRHGIQVTAPPQFNYDLLAFYGMADVQGKPAPQLVFIQHAPQGVLYARVYVLSAKKFDLKNLDKGVLGSASHSVEFNLSEDGAFGYLIVYRGESLAPFLAIPTQPAA